LNSTRPAFTSFTALAVSSVTVPVFGFGIRPRGPSTLPSLRTSTIASGVAIATSKSVQPLDALLDHVLETDIFRASGLRGIRRVAPFRAKTSTRTVLPLPCGKRNRAANHLVGLLRVNAEAEREINRSR
jgi:hypothetical protein